MYIPSALNKGDEIRIVSTARKISKEELKPAVELLKSWGYKPTYGNNLFEEDNQFAGTDLQRATDVIDAWQDEHVKAIWCARGGYGSIRLIEYFKHFNPNENPKWLIGYSDITVLHGYLNQHNIASLHATMPINVSASTSAALNSLNSCLTHNYPSYQWQGEHTAKGTFTGTLIGGNLSILYALNGTPMQFNSKGAILFIEDLDEYLYHVDRMMQTLTHSDFLNQLNAVVVGGLSDMNDNAIPFGSSAKEIIFNTFKKLNIPVVFDFPAGHINNNCALPLGLNATLETGTTNTLSFG